MADDIATERTPSLNRWQTCLLFGLLFTASAAPPILAIVLALTR